MTADSSTTPPPLGPLGASFCTTRWTAVRRAKADSDEGRQALADLCEAYYEPVAAFLKWELRNSDAARDLAHEFFAAMLRGEAIANAERERGRFRSFLLGAVKHFLSNRRAAARRLKRGREAECVSLDDEDAAEARAVADASVLSPDKAFDRQWALTVLARAMEALRLEHVAEGREEFFESVKPWLTGDAAHGEQTMLVNQTGLNATALRVAVHRTKKRFRQLVKAEVAQTLDNSNEVDAEVRELFAALVR
ncbi:MAG: sigma-70 family RNA polymerase sigma factor [Verrucomicrobia bacterium]|nr:sigma-70 family RNA polymerase sigma factor [Verrucomicrobiota bacterium]